MRRLLLSLVVLVSALLLGGWLVLGRQAQTLGEGLVRDALALDARRFELEAGTPGELLACAGREADLSPDIGRTLPWTLPHGASSRYSQSPGQARGFFTSDPVDLRYQMYAVYLDDLHTTLDSLSRARQ